MESWNHENLVFRTLLPVFLYQSDNRGQNYRFLNTWTGKNDGLKIVGQIGQKTNDFILGCQRPNGLHWNLGLPFTQDLLWIAEITDSFSRMQVCKIALIKNAGWEWTLKMIHFDDSKLESDKKETNPKSISDRTLNLENWFWTIKRRVWLSNYQNLRESLICMFIESLDLSFPQFGQWLQFNEFKFSLFCIINISKW